MAKLNLDLARCPKLSLEQLGHIRHFHNLASQLDGEWKHMGSQEPLQEFLDAYRYQMATMAYAAGAAHYHRQPILRSPYKTLFRQLIHKMLHRAVWGYWFNPSLGGIQTDPDLKELRKPWADPVVRENIMIFGQGVDFVRALYDADEKLVLLTFRSWDGRKHGIVPVVKNLAGGSWAIHINGQLTASRDVPEGGEFAIDLSVFEDMDVAVIL